jgi:hypothetical protein
MVKQSHYSRSISEHIVSRLVSHKLLKRVARLVPLLERELFTLPELYHLRLRVECILFCNLQSRARTNTVLVIGLYELLGNPIN